jgi:hypothetical protein
MTLVNVLSKKIERDESTWTQAAFKWPIIAVLPKMRNHFSRGGKFTATSGALQTLG